jgi:hypothetical protein
MVSVLPTETEQQQLDSMVRARDFVRTRADILQGIANLPPVQQLDGAIDAILGHGNTQGTSDRIAAARISRQRALAKQLVRSHMVPIAKFARAKLRGTPDFAALTRAGEARHPVTLLREARSMSAAAKPYAESFVAGGFPADTIEKLDEAVKALSDAVEERGHLRHVRVGATKGIKEQTLLGREAVRLLDAVISRQFASDETVLAAWASASRVDLPIGPARVASVRVPGVAPSA